MAAVLSSEMDGAERDRLFVTHIEDCRRMGIEVLAPNINEGNLEFRLATEGKIHFGLGAVKGVGFKAVEAIIKARDAKGPYSSLDDFFDRVSTKDVGAGCVETLIHAGAFDCLGAKRSQLLAVLPRALQAGHSKQDDRRRGQLGLFDRIESAAGPNGNGHGRIEPLYTLPELAELSEADKLAGEKKALGFYMSSHPLARHATLLQALASYSVADAAALSSKAEVILGGMMTNVQTRNVQKSRSGQTRMCKFSFEDLTGTISAMLWPDEYARMAELIKSESIGWIKGNIDRRRETPEVVVSRIIPLERGPAELTRGVIVRLQKGIHDTAHLERLLRAVRIHPGNLDLLFEIVGLEHIRRALYRAGTSMRIRYDERLLPDLEEAVGVGQVRLLGQRGATAHVDTNLPSSPTPLNDDSSVSRANAATSSDLDDGTFEEVDEL
jgi:DNA polymerase-3 subunit alpha